MKSLSRTRNYLYGLGSSYVVTVVTVAVGLWLTPLTLRYLDQEQYAVFVVASDILMWLGLLELGFAAVLQVKAAQLSWKKDSSQVSVLASTVFFAQVFIATVILALGLAISYFIPDTFVLRPDLRADAITLMSLLAFSSAVSVSSQAYSSLLVAHQLMHVDNLIRLLLIAVRTLVTVVLLSRGFGMVSLALANLAAVALAACLAVWRVHRYLPSIRIHRSLFSWVALRGTIEPGLWLSVGGLAGILIMNVDRVVAAKLVSLSSATVLSLTGRTYVLAWSLVQIVTNAARPALAQIIGEGRMGQALSKYHQLVIVGNGIAILCATSLWAGNGVFVSWWVGDNNYGGVRLDAILAANLILHSWVLPNRAIITAGLIHYRQNSGSRLAEGVLNIAVSIGFGFIWGLKGIVLGTTLSSAITTCWYLPVLTARYFKVDAASLIRPDLSKLAPFLVVMLPVAYAARRVGESLSGLVGAICASGICLSAGAFILYWLILDAETRRIVCSRLLRTSESSAAGAC